MQIPKQLKSKKGAAIELAVIFALVVFSLGTLLIGMVSANLTPNKEQKRKLESQLSLSQIGEYFVRACEFGGDFPTDDRTGVTYNVLTNSYSPSNYYNTYPWMDEDTKKFFAKCANNGYYFETSVCTLNQGTFWNFYTSQALVRKLVVKDRTGSVLFNVSVLEDYIYDESGVLLTKSSNPETRFTVINWATEDCLSGVSGQSTNILQKIWKWVGGIFGATENPENTTKSVVYSYETKDNENHDLKNTPTCGVTTQGYSGSNLTMPRAVCEGYEFLGWSLNTSYGGTYRQPGSQLTETDFSGVATGSGLVFYAKWKPYTIILKDGEEQITTYKAKSGQLPSRTRDGYFFLGWQRDADRNSDPVPAGSVISAQNDNDIYFAQWIETSQCINIEYITNGAVGGTAENVTLAPNTESLVLPTVSKQGHTFEGWQILDENNNPTGNALTGTYNIGITSGTIKFKAKFEKINYTITYKLDNSTHRTQTYTITDRVEILSKPAVAGKSVSDWVVGTSNDNNWTENDKSGTLSAGKYGNVTLSATSAAYKISVSYYNGTTECTGIWNYGDGNTLPSSPTRTGYTFAGWAISPSGAATISSGKITPTNDCSVTATWTANKYTVSYNVNEGNALTTTSKQVTFGSTYGTLPSPTRTGYDFAGWYTAASGGTQVTAGSTVNRAENHTIFAHWTKKKYTVTFDANSGSVSPSSKEYEYGSTYGTTLPTPTRTGYDFAGWYTAASGGTQIASTNTITSAKTIYAHWTAKSITVNFNANNGSVSPTSTTVTYASTYGTLPTPTRSNYNFDGWYTAASGGSHITSSSTVTVTSAQTLYAHWTGKSITVTFNANSGSVSPASKTVTYASTYGDLPTPTRSDYNFDGWYTAKSGGTKITSSSTVTVTSAQTLYAHWSSNPCITGDTLITMADGSQKPISDIRSNEKVLAFNHETGKYESTDILVNVKSATGEYNECKLNFSDGTKINIINSHGLFDYTLKKYVVISVNNANEYIGHQFVIYDKNSGENSTVVLKDYIVEKVVETPY